MKVQFKMPRCIDGVNYGKGIHVVPDALAKHWYLLAAVQNGVAVILEGPSLHKAKPAAPPIKLLVKEHVPSEPSPAPNYQDLMNGSEDKAPVEQASIEEEHINEELALKLKRSEAAKKAAATRAAKKAQGN